MSTPLRLARDLRLAFPHFHEVRVARVAPYVLHFYCVVTEGIEAAMPAVLAWLNSHHVAGTKYAVEQVVAIPVGLADDEQLLRRSGLKRVVVEEAQVTRNGITNNLRSIFPDEVVDVTEAGHGAICVHLDATVPHDRDRLILDTARVLMACDVFSLTTSRTVVAGRTTATGAESSEANQRLKEDRAFLEDYLPDVLDGLEVPFGAALPSGAATYASPFDGVTSLYQRLALFDLVYVHVPFKEADFVGWTGSTLEEILSALPTGRVIPVLAHQRDRYEPGLISQIVDAGPARIVLPGEAALRTIQTFATEHPLLTLMRADDRAAQDVRMALAESPDPNAPRVRAYVEAVADVAARVGTAAMRGPALELGWFPVAQWLDDTIVARFNLPSRVLELGAALDVRIMSEALGGRPMSQADHYMDGYLRFVYGAYPGEDDVLRVPDPEVIGRIAFPDTKGLSLGDFARDFRGPVVAAMRELMTSERVHTATSADDLIREFNGELKQYARRARPGYAAVGLLLNVCGLFASLGVASFAASLTLEAGRQILERRAPGILATIASKLTRTTREAALLAQIKSHA